MNDDADNLPVLAADGDVVVAMQPEGLLVGGDPTAVESYLERLRTSAGHAVQVTGIGKSSLGNATGLLTGVAAILGQSGKYVQLHPDSIKAVQQGRLIPGTDGFFRMTTRGAGNKFVEQLQWRPTAMGPQTLVSAQMVAMQLALKSAIAEVENAVRRVEGKVEQVLQLAQADRAGDVLGTHAVVSRKVSYLEKHGSLPDADWDAVAGLGPALNITIERLRSHVTRVLDSLAPGLPVQERANKLKAVVSDSLIDETLSLLVVAEESLYKWQRVRLARIEANEVDHLSHAIDDARDLLMHHLSEDAKLYRRARDVIDAFAKTDAIDGFRFVSVKQLARDRNKLQADLGAFAKARRNQVDIWTAFEAPSIGDAAEAGVELAKETARKALAAAGQGLINISERLAQRAAEKQPMEKRESQAGEAAE
ncbi:hypothetical protein [Mycolicibacter sinensis]|uniref:hypothetical protein n=1 Tax=Mycolicibacter sinensis (strain JDM601) TaxID=875328 RepID=UPI000AB8671F|nr:hypothetical protein [Mycolicibacter sinensis]